uniref:Uncharacterized protein n=1 Tax=Amphimedon queenslandica TaxID=400682 RepID=A0A1X7TVM6_AMPQE
MNLADSARRHKLYNVYDIEADTSEELIFGDEQDEEDITEPEPKRSYNERVKGDRVYEQGTLLSTCEYCKTFRTYVPVMHNLRGKASAKELRKLMKEKKARAKAKCSVDERHDITAEPVLRSSASVECSGGVLNEGLCDVATEQEVISGSVCDHNPELCDVTEYVP